MTHNWVRITNADGQSYLAEDNGDGTVTMWQYHYLGLFGPTGSPNADATISKPNRKDQKHITMLERRMAKLEAEQATLQSLIAKAQKGATHAQAI